jgi:hypothetical protein
MKKGITDVDYGIKPGTIGVEYTKVLEYTSKNKE